MEKASKECLSWFGSNLFDTLIVFLKYFFLKSIEDKNMKNYPARKELKL